MSDFFPTDYLLSFKQFNYEDLEKKISMLHDSKLLSDASKSIKNHIISNYSEDLLFAKFENILKKGENE